MEKKENTSKKIWLAGVFVLIIALWVVNLFLVPHLYPNGGDKGLFGDMFGGVNALFSGLAFWGVIYAILLQRDELKLQRKELKMNRKELENQSKALVEQGKSMREELEITKRKEKARKISIKPCFGEWKIARSEGPPTSCLYTFVRDDDKTLCPKLKVEHIEGGDGFNGGGRSKSGSIDVVKTFVRLKQNEKVKFKFRYSDREEDWYGEIVEFDVTTKKFEVVLLTDKDD